MHTTDTCQGREISSKPIFARALEVTMLNNIAVQIVILQLFTHDTTVVTMNYDSNFVRKSLWVSLCCSNPIRLAIRRPFFTPLLLVFIHHRIALPKSVCSFRNRISSCCSLYFVIIYGSGRGK